MNIFNDFISVDVMLRRLSYFKNKVADGTIGVTPHCNVHNLSKLHWYSMKSTVKYHTIKRKQANHQVAPSHRKC